MSKRAKRIKALLLAELSPQALEVINESALHKGHSGDDGTNETHFRILISAKTLTDLPPLESHRRINNLLTKEFATGLHALSIKVKRQ